MKNIQILTLSLLLATLSASLFSAADDRFSKKTFDEKFLSHIKKHSIGLFVAHQLQANEKLNKDLREAIKVGNLSEARKALDKGANIEHKDAYGSTPLKNAINVYYYWSPEIVHLLLDKGANIEMQSASNRTPLLESAIIEWPHRSELLLERGANIEAKDIYGFTPLHLAAFNNNQETVKLLLKKGAEINATNYRRGDTPLHGSIRDWRSPEIIKDLLNVGINLEIRNTNGKTAKDIAQEERYFQALRLIEAEEQRREDFYAGRGSEYADLQALTSLFGDEADLIEKEVAQEITDYVLPDRFVRLLALKKKRDANSASASPSAASAQE